MKNSLFNKNQKILKNVQRGYDQIAKEFDNTRQHAWPEFKLFYKYLKSANQIVDLGCGNGRLWNFFKNRQNEERKDSENVKELKKIKYIGIDNSKGLLEKAKENNQDLQSKFMLGDLTKIPLEENYTDILCMIAAFHHLPSKKLRIKCLEEIKRVLKPKGILIISVWNLFQTETKDKNSKQNKKFKKFLRKAFWKSILTLGYYHPRDCMVPWGNSGVNRYYYAFKDQEIEKLLESQGFKIIEKHKDRNINYICKYEGK